VRQTLILDCALRNMDAGDILHLDALLPFLSLRDRRSVASTCTELREQFLRRRKLWKKVSLCNRALVRSIEPSLRAVVARSTMELADVAPTMDVRRA
jgi:hypothetical protein